MNIHEKYLTRCLQIAKNGLGIAAPNPAVGAVITHRGRIIGQGFTSAFGGPHAEVRAINSVADKELLRDATLYVTLEPCSHHGKTPPCTDLILASGIPRVVLGISDPFEKVSGRGIQVLREGGCEVLTGILEAACREHHKRFLTSCEQKRPYLILKWAQSPDGFIAPVPAERRGERRPFWISSPLSRQLVHKWRTEEQAVLVGTHTAVEDNPELTARSWKGRHPLRIVLDEQLRLPASLKLFDGASPTLVFHAPGQTPPKRPHTNYQAIDFRQNLPEQICQHLHARGISSLIVEGGAATLNGFIALGLWDEARIFTGSRPLHSGIPAPRIRGAQLENRVLGGDRLEIWKND